jgi:Predicted N6-adenine-specific DNA methylase
LIYKMVAPCYFGTEAVVSYDLRRIGAQNIELEDGRAFFEGDADIIVKANIHSRSAERILILLAKFKAETFDELFDGVYAISWEDFLPKDAEFPVKGSSLSSTLSSVPACQSIVKKAIVEKMRKTYKTEILPETGNQYRVRISLRKNIAEVYLDTSGVGLHKRGYRRNAGEAPIKETLAATMADIARVKQNSLVQDPFCGSGTLLIESAMKALCIAPGLKRRFAAENYDFINGTIWQEARREALADIIQDAEFEAIGFDIDEQVLDIAKKNAKFAGVEKYCKFFKADVADFAPSENSIILTNPPYGERMSDSKQVVILEKTLSERLSSYPVKGSYIISADNDFETNFGKKATRRRKLYNGMIPCQLYMYYDK